jgi:hypothetical protein
MSRLRLTVESGKLVCMETRVIMMWRNNTALTLHEYQHRRVLMIHEVNIGWESDGRGDPQYDNA